jgi:UDP-glucose 4-epimerase
MATLVTGGNGFIGSYVIKNLLEKGEEVVCFDRVDPPPLMSRLVDLARMRFIRGDVQDLANLCHVVAEERISRIVHAAAVLTPVSQKDPLTASRVNIGGTLHILEAARRFKIARVVFCSSVTAYGAIKVPKQPEEYPKNPVSTYGVTKLACELFGIRYAEDFAVDFVALRFPMIYGWRASPMQGVAVYQEIIEKAWSGRPAVVTTIEGKERKLEPLYIKDAARAVLLALFKEGGFENRIFNISSGQTIRIKEMMKIIKELMHQSNVHIKVGPDAATRTEGSLDLSRAARELGYTPDYLFQEGVKDYITYLERIEAR